MDVRCDRCQTEYELDDSSLADDGVTVRCTNCGNTFLVTREGQAATPSWAPSVPTAPPSSADWTLKTEDGTIHRFRDLSRLHQWIVERRVTRQDQLAHGSEPFRPLGALADLKPFFDVVDQADLARQADANRPTPVKHSSRVSRVSADFGVDENTPVFDPPPELRASPGDDGEDFSDQIPRSGPGGKRMALALGLGLLLAAGGGAALWAVSDRRGARPQPPAAAVSLPPQTAPAPVSPTPATPPPAAAVAPTRATTEPAPTTTAAAPAPPAPAAVVPAAPVAAAAVPAAVAVPPAAEAADPRRAFERLVQDADRLLENGKTSKAQKLYEQALKLKPDGVEALTGIAYALLDQQRSNEAVLGFKRALAASAGHGPAIFGLAEAYRAAGQKAQALDSYRKYLVASPSGRDAPAARTAIRDLESTVTSSSVATVHEPPRPAAPPPDKAQEPEKAPAEKVEPKKTEESPAP